MTGVLSWFKGLIGNGDGADVEITGTIVDKPLVIKGEGGTLDVISFHLDSRPDLEFRQTARPLVPPRNAGDVVKIHCRLDGGGIALVEWIEKG